MTSYKRLFTRWHRLAWAAMIAVACMIGQVTFSTAPNAAGPPCTHNKNRAKKGCNKCEIIADYGDAIGD